MTKEEITLEATVGNKPVEDIKPPVTQVGVIGWIRTNLFNGWLNSLLTILTLYCLWVIVPPLIRWAFIDSLWLSTGAECQQSRRCLLVHYPRQYTIYNVRIFSV